MAWYYILFFLVLGFFIVKTIISWVFGDIDFDFDADGDIDFDLSSVLSFKGILHFLLGFSTYLSAIARFDTSYSTDTIYQFSIMNYIIAIIIGIIFTVGLWYLYTLMMKLNHSSSENPDFVGCSCNVLANLGNGKYVVLIKTPSGTFKKTVSHKSNIKHASIGEEYRIAKNIETDELVIC